MSYLDRRKYEDFDEYELKPPIRFRYQHTFEVYAGKFEAIFDFLHRIYDDICNKLDDKAFMRDHSLSGEKIYYNIQHISFHRNIRTKDEFVTPEEWEERVRALETKKSERSHNITLKDVMVWLNEIEIRHVFVRTQTRTRTPAQADARDGGPGGPARAPARAPRVNYRLFTP